MTHRFAGLRQRFGRGQLDGLMVCKQASAVGRGQSREQQVFRVVEVGRSHGGSSDSKLTMMSDTRARIGAS
jgi:hypothetical protein